jgi:hypothetical protein
MATSASPLFDRCPAHHFSVGQRIYVIDQTGVSLIAGTVSAITSANSVFRVQYADISGPVDVDKSRVLPSTPHNDALYLRQTAASVPEDPPSADAPQEDSDDPPAFERDPDHEFTVDEGVYVIDPNEFDIYEAKIEQATRTKCLVDYPEYPEDRGWVSRRRVLSMTPHNIRIFDDQEAARQEGNAEVEEAPDSEEQVDFRKGRRFRQKKKQRLVLTLDIDPDIIQKKDVEIRLRLRPAGAVQTGVREIN